MRPIVIAIDGYAATGKSTTARGVAELLGYIHVDSGAMYRAVAWHIRQKGVVRPTPEMLPELLADFSLHIERKGSEIVLFVNSQEVHEELRLPEISALASEVSTIPWVRERLIAEQRRLGQRGGIVMDGRDIGTVVFPQAELKVFMQASLPSRVERRYRELIARGIQITPEEVQAELIERDRRDETRSISPLRRAPDARLLDTTHLSIPEQIAIVVRWAEALIYAPFPS
ncbi:MAG: (d)CMP kinase [Bacteroidia bacterium]|nr:(d)CMP kinase [Bacteroidia bacterium]MCX7763324.1 (d)CMP kinase [Bacteroidia bacterium]MDW8057103.1 (d)CMP kinase [Bacteroidia bacterium]